jgi:hypothetical protein
MFSTNKHGILIFLGVAKSPKPYKSRPATICILDSGCFVHTHGKVRGVWGFAVSARY